MITDPRTAPETARGRQIYAVSIGLLVGAPDRAEQTEFQAKVALLGSLTIVCAARPLIILRARALRPPRDAASPPTDGRALRALRSAPLAAAPWRCSPPPFAGLHRRSAGTPARSRASVSLDLADDAVAPIDRRSPRRRASRRSTARTAQADRRRRAVAGAARPTQLAELPRRADAPAARAGARPGTADRRRDAHRARRAHAVHADAPASRSTRHALHDRAGTGEGRPQRPR